MTTVSSYLTTMTMDGALMTMTMATTIITSTASGSATSTSSSSTSTSTSDSSSSSMDMDMSSMNSYFTTTWLDYPIIFETLKASNGGTAFAIFLLLFVVGFFFRGLSFLSAYVEQRIFHNYYNSVIVEHTTTTTTNDETNNCACDDGGMMDDDDDEEAGKYSDSKSSDGLNNNHNSSSRSSSDHKQQHIDESVTQRITTRTASPMRQFFLPGVSEFGKDIVRLIIAFITAMFGYVLMIAAMSYVVLYFFAVVLGIAFGEVFFNRLAIVCKINKNSSLCSSLH